MQSIRKTAYFYRFIAAPLLGVALLLVLGISMSGSAHAEPFPPPGAGYLDFFYGNDVTGDSNERTPTESKPESKLWWNDGFWWGSMYNDAVDQYHIYRLNWGTQMWEDTGVVLDDRKESRADALWDKDNQKLYVASHFAQQKPSKVSTISEWARVYRFSYNKGTQSYTLDAGFPVTVNEDKTESLVFDKDSTGRLWVTYVSRVGAIYRVYVNATTVADSNNPLASDTNWGTPMALTTLFPAEGEVAEDDISALIPFRDDSGKKIGVMWSNSRINTLDFAWHPDSAADFKTGWTLQSAIALPNGADDHINLKSLQTTSSGQVFAAVKTSNITSTEPLIGLVARDVDGAFSFHTYSTVTDRDTRPLLLLDEGDPNNPGDNQARLFVSAIPEGRQICYKSLAIPAPPAPLAGMGNFPAGNCGTSFILDASGVYTTVRDPSSTKQNPNATTGIVVLASDVQQKMYVHNKLGNPPPVMTARGPQPNAIDVAVGAVITATFSKPMNLATFENNFTVTGGAPVAGTISYDAASRTATFTPAAPLQPNTTYTVILTNGIQDDTGLALNQGIDTGTVIEQWTFTTASTTVAFANVDYSVLENAGTAQITLTLGAAVAAPVTVNYSTSDGTAVAGQDYTAANDTVTFAPGDIQKSFVVAITNDVNDETNETVNLSLNTPNGATLGTPVTATLTIIDDEGAPTVQFNPASYSVDEGGTVALTVQLSHSSVQPITVNYAASDGTATASDYAALSDTLTFAVGETIKQIVLTSAGDTIDEADENLTVTLSAPINAELGIPGDKAAVTIHDKTTAATVQLSSATYTVNENGGTATMTATLSSVSASEVTVAYATANGIAKAGEDYVATNATLVFAPGQTSKSFSVTITNDPLDENDETIQVKLSNAVNAALGAIQNAVLTIVDEDPLPKVAFSNINYSVDEDGEIATIEVKLSAASGRGVTVDYAVSNGTATAGSDYATISGTLLIPAGTTTATFDIDIVDDKVSEAGETVNLLLSAPVGATLDTTATATLTITDDEPTTGGQSKLYLPLIRK